MTRRVADYVLSPEATAAIRAALVPETAAEALAKVSAFHVLMRQWKHGAEPDAAPTFPEMIADAAKPEPPWAKCLKAPVTPPPFAIEKFPPMLDDPFGPTDALAAAALAQWWAKPLPPLPGPGSVMFFDTLHLLPSHPKSPPDFTILHKRDGFLFPVVMPVWFRMGPAPQHLGVAHHLQLPPPESVPNGPWKAAGLGYAAWVVHHFGAIVGL